MKSLKIKIKMTILMILAVLSGISVAGTSIFRRVEQKELSLETMEVQIQSDFDQKMKEQVDSAVSVLQQAYDAQLAGAYTKEEAQKLAADLLRNMKYGDDGSLWADKSDGTCVVLLAKDTEGTNRADAKDVNGFSFIQENKKQAMNVAAILILPFQERAKRRLRPKENILHIISRFIWF